MSCPKCHEWDCTCPPIRRPAPPEVAGDKNEGGAARMTKEMRPVCLKCRQWTDNCQCLPGIGLIQKVVYKQIYFPMLNEVAPSLLSRIEGMGKRRTELLLKHRPFRDGEQMWNTLRDIGFPTGLCVRLLKYTKC